MCSHGSKHEASLKMVLIYRIRYRAYSLPKKEFQGMDLALRSTLQREWCMPIKEKMG